MIDFSIDIKTLAIFSGIYLLLFAIAEVAYHYFKVNVEYTRKFVHIMTGVIALFFPIYILNPIDLIILCVSFAILLVLSIKWNLLQSVNAIKRPSRGSILYPVVVVVCYLFQYYKGSYTYYFIPILILALADPAAAWAGSKFRYRPFSILGNSKTIGGSIGFFIVAFLIANIGLYLRDSSDFALILLCSLLIAFLTSVSEALSIRGYDNLFIPLAAIAGLLIYTI